MERTVEPEILDHLPADHPDALASRRDLRLINALLGNYRWLRRRIPPGSSVLEIGAGDGSLGGGTGWTGLDLAPTPLNWPQGGRWIQGDVFDEKNWGEADVVVANLFLHHFQTDQLRWIGARVRRYSRRFLACEPRRARLPMANGAVLGIFADLNPVTWQDMMISIRAGFRGNELACMMDFGSGYTIAETLLGSYRLDVRL